VVRPEGRHLGGDGPLVAGVSFPLKDVLLSSTYAVVVFSVLVQGLTIRRVLVRYGVGQRSD
jgi:NhaP-type Na+/H+ or K+/H+ antiporter